MPVYIQRLVLKYPLVSSKRLWLAATMLFSFATSCGASISGSKHDLSNPGQPQVCIFCHVPHNANPDLPALWNRKITDLTVFKFYTSSTMNTRVSGGVPSGNSLLCLSCHDELHTTPYSAVSPNGSDDVHNMIYGVMGTAPDVCGKCHPLSGGSFTARKGFRIGADLRDDHPISVPYPTSGQDPEFATPPNATGGWTDVKLYSGKIECGSCHDPHSTAHNKFLRKSNAGSGLCLTCHQK